MKINPTITIISNSEENQKRSQVMWHGTWPESLTCSEVKHQPTSLIPGWVTHPTYTCSSIKTVTHRQNANGHIWRCLISIKNKCNKIITEKYFVTILNLYIHKLCFWARYSFFCMSNFFV